MLAAYNYPILDIFWTMAEVFLFILWIWLLITIFVDIFRSHDMRGWAKALWVIVLIILPLVGVLIYLIARGGGMHERAVKQAQLQEKAFQQYVQQAAATSGDSAADQLAKLADLRDQGKITEDDFQKGKTRILS